jgi:hypothetical protein
MNKDDERKRKLGWWTAAWGAGWFLACIVGWQTVLGMVLGGGTGSVVAPGVPRTAPVVTASSWEPVAFWRGSGIKNTDAFTVQSPWRIGWRTWPSETMMGMDGNFIIQVYDLANTSGPMAGLPVEVAANVIGRSEDYSTYYTSGTLRLEINASQEYELTVYQGVP